MVLTPEEQTDIEERFERLEERNAKLERLIRSGKAFTSNPLALATDLDDLGSVKTHLDFEEPPLTPINPPADVLRVSAKDVSDTTGFALLDSAGVETVIVARTRYMPLSVMMGQTSGRLADAVTNDWVGGVPVPVDWVAGTDIILHAHLFYKSSGAASMLSRIHVAGIGETSAKYNYENVSQFPSGIQDQLRDFSRTIAAASIAADDTIWWQGVRQGGAGADTVNNYVSLDAVFIEYTAFF